MIAWLSSSVKRIFGFKECGLHPRVDELIRIKGIIGFSGGGIHKRIDENRELLELIQREASEFLATHPWVENWIASNDEFFISLEDVVPITEGRFLGQAQCHPDKFPRPWPGQRWNALAHISGEEDVAKEPTC